MKHAHIEDSTHAKVKEYCEENNLKITKEYSRLIEAGLKSVRGEKRELVEA